MGFIEGFHSSPQNNLLLSKTKIMKLANLYTVVIVNIPPIPRDDKLMCNPSVNLNLVDEKFRYC